MSFLRLYIHWMSPYPQMTGQDSRSLRFGMRKVEQGKHHIRLNDRDIHLRGVLELRGLSAHRLSFNEP